MRNLFARGEVFSGFIGGTKVFGGAGTYHFILFAGACPRIGAFSAGENIIKVTLFAGDKIANCRRVICGRT
ncbi:hypothetical protein [Ignatzschineria sp. F8392]|uniref:hypothetical protein n=1 Tax=Ignatzschineria sp. F8392 TaxID=1980117 RepID=UPI001179F138|nr:hypothetical protein [Ignatzschineria sp. F8392]